MTGFEFKEVRGPELDLSVPRCRAMIDQGRRIGSDPVGHGCIMAAYSMHKGFPLCEHHTVMIQQEPERVSFPTYPTGPLSWEQWADFDRQIIAAVLGRAR